jgi:Fe-S cluster assembly protein SufD
MTPAGYREALAQTAVAAPQRLAREAALTRFLARGLPTTRDEAWRYTALDYPQKTELHAPREAPAAPTTEACPGAVLGFANGRLSDPYAQTLHAHSLAARADSAPVARHLGRLVGALAGGAALADINSALWQDGLLLHLPAGWKQAPLFVVHDASEADAMLHVRNLVVLEAGAEAVLVEHLRGTPGLACWLNGVSEILLGEDARLTHLVLDESSAAATHTRLTLVDQLRGSRYRALTVNLGGRVLRHEIRVKLGEADADCQLDGVFVADARRHIDHHLHIDHAAPRTVSGQTWRGIAAGRGRGIFDARVRVQPGAFKADARQSSRNLLLSPHAEIDVKPQLEIFADDVQCAHGATVGQLDAAEMFYLRSRGIDAAAARALLLRGFADAALGIARHSGLADWLEPHLAAALALREERAA